MDIRVGSIMRIKVLGDILLHVKRIAGLFVRTADPYGTAPVSLRELGRILRGADHAMDARFTARSHSPTIIEP